MDKHFTQSPDPIMKKNTNHDKSISAGNPDSIDASNFDSQVAGILAASERARLLMEATPMACHLWSRKYEMLECNEENIRLFNLTDKHDLLRNQRLFLPEYQPDGQLSVQVAHEYIDRAFNEGKQIFECVLQTLDRKPIPAEVTLFRLAYDDDDVVVGYIRDLREHKRIMEGIHQRDNLLNAVNEAAYALLTMGSEESFESSFLTGMGFIGSCVNVDRIYILKNEIINGELYFTFQYEWANSASKLDMIIKKGLQFPYSINPEWFKKFLEGECMNGPLKTFSKSIQDFFSWTVIKSVLTIPIFIDDYFWGLINFSDFGNERVFTNEEIKILQSGALMMVNAINRNEQASEIREAHNRSSLLLESMPIGANLWDKTFKLFDCNEEAVKLFNLQNKEEYIRRFPDLSPKYQPDGSRSLRQGAENVKTAFETGRHVFEWMHQMPDRTPLPVEVILVRVPYEDDFVVAGYFRDLREQKKNMREIEQRDYLLNTVNKAANILLQSTPDDFADNLHYCMGMFAEAIGVDRISICRNDLKDDKLYYSQVFEWTNKAKAETDAPGSYNYSTDIVNEINLIKYYSEVIPSWEKTLSEGKCINRLVRDMPPLEQEYLEPKGILAVFVMPVLFQDQFTGFVSYINYHNERQFTENEEAMLRSGGLVFANALLQKDMMQNLRTAAVQLEAALGEAQKANSAKSDFLAKMSHEMRTPLTAIIGLSELSIEKEELDWETYSNLVKINNAGMTLLGTVNDILDISKIEAGMMELVQVDYDVASLINDTLTQNILRIGEKPIKLILDLDENMFSTLHGDELRIRQIMNNLLSNAIKYTQEGEVELGLSCDREGDQVWLTIKVKDTGYGIKPEDIKKLYINFAQIDLTHNRRIEGTGLGLPITKRLAEMMNGTIAVESEYGKGSVFTVKIVQKYVSDIYISPDVVENLKNFRYSDSRSSLNRQLKRINLPYAKVLVVDDNLANLDVIKGLMKPYGMQIDCVTDGQEAVHAIRSQKVKYNAIFMDHMMPGMDGVEATRLIREMDTDYARNIPIIAITANAIAGNEEFLLNRGFQAFLSKPIDLPRLDEAIRRWVRDKELENEFNERQLSTAATGASSYSPSGHMTDRRIYPDRRSGIDRRKVNTEFVGLDIDKGLERFGGDMEIYMDVLRSYAVNTRPLLESIGVVSRDKLADYAIIVHGIKGSSRGILAEMIGESAEKLEKAAKAGDYSFVAAHNPTFLYAAWKLIHDLENLLAAADAENPKPTKDKPDNETLLKIFSACQEYDIDSLEEIVKDMEKYRYTSDDGLAAWLSNNVKLTNFKEIIELLSNKIE